MQAHVANRKTVSAVRIKRTCPVVGIIAIMWWVEAMRNSKSRFKEE